MAMNILQIAPIISDIKSTVQFMRLHNLLLQDYWCCETICSKVMDISLKDREIFQCNICTKRYSIRTGSFWFKSKLQLNVLLGLLYFFSIGSSITEVCKFFNSKISRVSAIQWYTYFRDIITAYLINNPVTFSNNCTVHCDETFIGGKRKYNKGRIPKTKTRWLFGIVDKAEHKAYIQFVPKKNHENIVRIIQQKVPIGSNINTDGAQVYKILRFQYNHKFVIHERMYVAPDGTHSNWIENFWSNLKMHLKSIRGSQQRMLDAHLDEYMYRYNRKHEGNMFDLLIADIANQYRI